MLVGIYKDGDETEANNYRPIAITSIIIRMYEYIIYKRLLKILRSPLGTNISKNQFGFVEFSKN